MEVLVAKKCGFCPGVRNAIRLAEKTLAQTDQVYSLGPIIHNDDEVERLARAGLKTVHSVDQVDSGTVIIRSHGARPDQIEALRQRGIKIVDATCVLVKRVQQIAQQLARDGYQVVVVGEAEHPEVQAVVGCAHNVTVLSSLDDLSKIPANAKLGIVAQTTQSPQQFGEMLGAVAQLPFTELKVLNTLCQESVKRQLAAVQLCKQVDVMFVLGGLHSANTRRLAELCRQHNPQTYHLQNHTGLDSTALAGKRIAGVTAGASTPDWVIHRFVEKLRNINPES